MGNGDHGKLQEEEEGVVALTPPPPLTMMELRFPAIDRYYLLIIWSHSHYWNFPKPPTK